MSSSRLRTYPSRYEEQFPWCTADPNDAGSARCKWCNRKLIKKCLKLIPWVKLLSQVMRKVKDTNAQLKYGKLTCKSVAFPFQKRQRDRKVQLSEVLLSYALMELSDNPFDSNALVTITATEAPVIQSPSQAPMKLQETLFSSAS
ncbi:uncharacterized protein LOC129766948 [Toxorhynchites rutilus septentrionalis]|uniref:uncharacterized protein LOC129766948 n=1 Tax=Toxorhynchites rutilus septentrionalis TaxID=329112 RepID=UPI002479CF39|nr:uncharacterized protein LOC129766948 [Toxorhynchites rutilus septentrionalis]